MKVKLKIITWPSLHYNDQLLDTVYGNSLCTENHTEPTNPCYGQNLEILTLKKQVVHIVTTELKVLKYFHFN